MRRVLGCIIVAVISSVASVYAQNANATYRTLMLTGDPIPGGAGLTFERATDGELGAGGHFLVEAVAGRETVLLLGGPDGFDLLAGPSTALPGLGDEARFVSLNHSDMNAQGQYAFIAQTSLGYHAVWTGSRGSMQLLAKSGDPIPDHPQQRTFTNIGGSFINASGTTALAVGDSLGFVAIVAGTPGLLKTLAYRNQSLPDGRYIASIRQSSYLSDDGHIAFEAALGPPSWPDLNGRSVLVAGADGIRPLARPGDPAPGAGYFTSAGRNVEMNGSGRVLFTADVVSGESLWVSVPGSVARVPNAPPTIVRPVQNDAGRIVCQSAGGEIFSGDADALHSIARSGNSAPGGGVFFLSNPSTGIGEDGTVAIYGGFYLNNIQLPGLWSTDENNQLQLLAAPGVALPVNGSWRTIKSFTTNVDITREGEVMFFATFTDGTSGVLLAKAQVPEPAEYALLLAATASVSLSRAWRRRPRVGVASLHGSGLSSH